MELENVLVQDISEAVKPLLHEVQPNMEATAQPRATETKRRLEADPDGSPESRAKLYRCAAVGMSLGGPCPAGELPLLVPQLQVEEVPGPSVVITQPEGHQPALRTDLSAGYVPQCSDIPQAVRKMLRDTQQQHVGSLEELHAQLCILQAQLDSQMSVRLEELEELQVQQSVLHTGMRSQVSVRMEEIRELQAQQSIVQAQHLEVEKRQQREGHLKKQLKDAFQEQRKLNEELKCSRQCFEETLQAKDEELEMTKEEKEQAWAQKNDMLNQMTNVLDNELKCIICYELLVEAVTLNCAHSFCQHCIREWQKCSRVCPLCKQNILSQTRSLVLDNIIERMVECLSTELKERREALLAERTVAVAMVLLSDEDTSDSSDSSGSMVNVHDMIDVSEPLSFNRSSVLPNSWSEDGSSSSNADHDN